MATLVFMAFRSASLCAAVAVMLLNNQQSGETILYDFCLKGYISTLSRKKASMNV